MTDDDIVTYAGEHYGAAFGVAVRNALQSEGHFADHVRRSFIREMDGNRRIELRMHDLLWTVCKTDPRDYEPYGEEEERHSDCSCGCVFAAWLQDMPSDWLVCMNPRSHRRGLLTFEHQGCHHFVGA